LNVLIHLVQCAMESFIFEGKWKSVSLNRSAFQRVTRRRAFTKWAEEWHADSFAYEYALTKPPNGHNHPLWTAAVDNINVSLLTTALRIAEGHAFISDYTRRFGPDIPKEENHCLCGFPPPVLTTFPLGGSQLSTAPAYLFTLNEYLPLLYKYGDVLWPVLYAVLSRNKQFQK
jgi:hypothetical protein